MSKEHARGIIVDQALEHPALSFARLEQAFVARGHDYEGDYGLTIEGYVLWTGWSTETWEAFQEALDADEIHLEPVPWVAYLLEGKVPNIPVAKGSDDDDDGHWVPCLIKPGPFVEEGVEA